MTNVEALKQVYTSLGGMLTDTYSTIANGVPVSDYSLISDVVAAISFKTGSGLPDVTAEDKGKVLIVDDDGEWTVAAPSDGIITVHATFKSAGLIDLQDITGAEIYQLLSSEKNVRVIEDSGNQKDYFNLSQYSASDGYEFLCIRRIGNSTSYTTFKITANSGTTIATTSKNVSDPT